MAIPVSVGDVVKLCEIATRVYKNCRDCPGEYKSLTGEARNLTNALEDISDKYDSIPESKRRQFLDAYESCVEVLQELDKLLLHYKNLDTKSKRAWDRLKWDPDKSKALRARLTSTVVMLNGFYTSLIHDNQVLIMEALGRLELDYRGGHREESIASVEQIASGASHDDADELEDAAWSQITRDLEDVGISAQNALEYRDFIVDWFVRAVNEGRLMERSAEQTALATLPQSFDGAPSAPADGLNVTMSTPPVSLPIRDPARAEPQNTAPVETHTTSSAQTSARSTRIQIPLSTINIEDALTSNQMNPTQRDEAAQSPDLPPPYPPTPITTSTNNVPSHILKEHDLSITARRIVDAWEQRDFHTAEKELEHQLAAVERGETVTMSGEQPDRRLLRHLIGVCASYSGNFVKAKQMFESVFNGLYLNGASLDDGDIAAARWLGDVCLHLQEPENAALAWSVSLDGLISRYGIARDQTQRVYEELHLLDYRLYGLQTLEKSFAKNVDCSTIFANTRALEKSNLVTAIQTRMKQLPQKPSHLQKPPHLQNVMISEGTMAGAKPFRARTDWRVAEGFLVQPLVSMSLWPLPWDPTFSPLGAVNLLWQVNASLHGYATPSSLTQEAVPSISLVRSQELLYISKRGIAWLVATVESGLREAGIDCTERGSMLICRVDQRRENFVFFEGIGIKFRKLQFRNLFGVKVTGVLLATRGLPAHSNSFLSPQSQQDANEFKTMVRSMLENAEAEAQMAESKGKGGKTAKDDKPVSATSTSLRGKTFSRWTSSNDKRTSD